MAFDPSLDKELNKKEKAFDDTKIIVSVMSYNGGKPKIQISRQNRNENGWIFSKLGRLTEEEAKALSQMLQEILEEE